MNTTNQSFNSHWEYLSSVLPKADLSNGESLSLLDPPKGSWLAFVEAFSEVVVVGLRNGWLNIWGGPVLYVPNEIASPSEKEKT